MSVQTRADDKRDSARQHIADAVQDLAEIFVDECWGHDDYRKEYRANLKEIWLKLMEMKDEF